MNYVILNGINSNTIEGLLIQSLPPISKPLMRTQIEEIDGRDGDLVTKLGYAAYDKEVSVGLHGAFDIDDVIAFFASEGQVIFSNEPDKYYRYRVLAQIEFEKLIRFRTATVTFHVQPYKYKANENPATASGGTSLTVKNAGNTVAKPKITITGSGDINVSLNGEQMFAITLGSEGYITIDTEAMEAYRGGTLKNRLVTGDYDNFELLVGDNVISWSGTVSQVTVERYSRWI